MTSRREFLQAAAALPPAVSAVSRTLQPTGLQCEYAVNPLGIDARAPRFFWQLPAATQSAYQLQVESAGQLLWDSGKVPSPQSSQVEYQGRPLASRRHCEWKVRVWDDTGAESRWSAPATFEMGLLDPTDWQARWITAAETGPENGTRTLPSPWFRKSFQLAARPTRARLYVCGLGFHEVWINGRRLGDHVLSPGQTDYDQRRIRRVLYPFDDQTAKRVLYETFDATPLLQPGENVVGVVLGNGWYNQRDRVEEGWLWYGTPRVILQLEADGRLAAATAADWRVTTAGPIVHNGIFTGEAYDARLEMPGWSAPGFDDAAWLPARLATPPAGPLTAQVNPPDRVVATLRPNLVAPGLYDAGQGLSGWARLRLRAPRGRKLTLEFLEEQGSDYGQSDSYVCRGGAEETWEPRFTWHAFRQIRVTGSADPLDLEVRVAHTHVPRAGSFACSNDLFNRIHETYVRTQLANMHGGVTSDCPHRERLGYTGDGQVAAQSAIYALDMARFYTKWTQDIHDARNHKTGFVPHTAPFEGGGGGPPWGSAMVLMPWYLYLYYGDRRALETHWEAMTAWVRYLSTRTDSTGVVVKEEPGGWFLGDWLPPEKIHLPAELVCTAFHAHCADLVARVAAILGRSPDDWRAIRDRAAHALHARFYDPANHCYGDGTQGASIFPLAFGLVPADLRRPVFEKVIAGLRRFDTGFIATPLLLDVLSEYGRPDLAARLLNQREFPSFGYMFDKGATTLWEAWDGKGSHMHPMFGGVCRWFWQSLAGIRPDPAHPGFARFFLQPTPVAEVDWVKARYETRRGVIAIAWQKKGDSLEGTLEVPGNTACTLVLPGRPPRTLGPGRHALA